MKKENLKDQTKDQLLKKKDSLKIFLGTFMAIFAALCYFLIRDYLMSNEIDWTSMIITICVIGGFLPVYQELKEVQEELGTRS